MSNVSIIITVYNVENYLRECLDSLVKQTLKDIEIICVDDGSTDNSLNILKEYQAKDNRIKIIEQENQGPGVARNIALNAATGDYVMIVDSDDWLESNACEIAFKQINKNQNDIAICNYKIYNELTKKYEISTQILKLFNDVIDKPNINLAELKRNFLYIGGYSWGKIYNRKFLIDNDIKYLPYRISEDVPFLYIALAKSKSASIISEPLYVYRKREGSSMSSANKWRDTIITRKYVADYFIKNNLKEPYLRFFTEQSFSSLMFWYNHLSQYNSSIKADFKNEIIEYIDSLSQYQNIKTKFRVFLFKYNLRGLYYKVIRPIGKYCIVLPYRKIQSFVKGI